MEVNNLGAVPPASPNSSRPQNAAKETPRATAEPNQPAATAGNGGEQAGPSKPRGSILDISI